MFAAVEDEREIIIKSNETINGDYNVIKGSNNVIRGNHNVIKGSNAKVEGDDNVILGNNATVRGNKNRAIGNNGRFIGNDNEAIGKNWKVKGSGNTIRKKEKSKTQSFKGSTNIVFGPGGIGGTGAFGGIRISNSSIGGNVIIRSRTNNAVIEGGIFKDGSKMFSSTGEVRYFAFGSPQKVSKKMQIEVKSGSSWQNLIDGIKSKLVFAIPSMEGKIDRVTITKGMLLFPNEGLITTDEVDRMMTSSGTLVVDFQNNLASSMTSKMIQDHVVEEEEQEGEPVMLYIEYPVFERRAMSPTAWLATSIYLDENSDYREIYVKIIEELQKVIPEAEIIDIRVKANDGYDHARFYPKEGLIPAQTLDYIKSRHDAMSLGPEGEQIGLRADVSVSNAPRVELPMMYQDEQSGQMYYPDEIFFQPAGDNYVPMYVEDLNFGDEHGTFIPEFALKDKCQICATPSNLTCAICRNVTYCGRKCQTKDWTMHKFQCKKK